MEDKTYALNIRHPSKFDYHITIPEIWVTTQSTANLDSALMQASQAIEKHFTMRYLMLVFHDEQDAGNGKLTRQAAFKFVELGITTSCKSKEMHLIYELSQPLTREQARWLDEQEGKLFYRYFTKDEIEMETENIERLHQELWSRKEQGV